MGVCVWRPFQFFLLKGLAVSRDARPWHREMRLWNAAAGMYDRHPDSLVLGGPLLNPITSISPPLVLSHLVSPMRFASALCISRDRTVLDIARSRSL